MSQRTRKYKRIEALFSKSQPVAPDSPLPAAADDRTGWVEKTQPQPPAEETRPESAGASTDDSPESGWQDFLNGIDRGRKMGFTYNHGKVSAFGATPPPPPENGLFVPLMVSGKMIGAIQGAGNEAGWTAQEIEMVSAVTAQLARHLENLRLRQQDEKHTQEPC